MSSPPQVTPAVTTWSDAWAGVREVATGVRPITLRGITTATATVLIAAMLCLPIGAAIQIALVAQVDDRTTTQAMVVMDPVRNWGQSAPIVKARAIHAADLYRQGIAPVIILPGTPRSTERSQAVLVEQGVPAQDIVILDTSADTIGSLRATAELLRGFGWSAVTLITDPAQAARAQATAGGLGIDAHMSPTDSGPGTALTAEYVGRETLALMRYYVLTHWSQKPIV